MRADSGFFDNALLGYLEDRSIPYIVVARLTGEIKRRLHGIDSWQEIEGGDYADGRFRAQLSDWENERRIPRGSAGDARRQ